MRVMYVPVFLFCLENKNEQYIIQSVDTMVDKTMCKSFSLFLVLLISVKSDYFIVNSNISSNFTAYNSSPTSLPTSMNVPTSTSHGYEMDDVYAVESFVDRTKTVTCNLVQKVELFHGAMISWPLSYYYDIEYGNIYDNHTTISNNEN